MDKGNFELTEFLKPEGHGIRFQSIYPNDKVAILQEFGPKFGVNVTILQKAGENYTHHSINKETNRPQIYNGTVPEGKSYVALTSPKNNLSDFWNAVRAKEQTQQSSANPPKS